MLSVRRQLDIHQDDVDGGGFAESEQLGFTLGIPDDVQAIIFAEKPSQPEAEEPFSCDDDDGDW